MFTRKEIAAAGVAVVGAGVLLYYTFGKKPKAPKAEPKPTPEPQPSKDDPNDPLGGLPHCATDRLIPGEVYEDANGTFFYVGPRQERKVIPKYPADPLVIDVEYSVGNAAWAIVGIAGLAASAGLVPAAWLGGVLVGGLRTIVSGLSLIYSAVPAQVQLYREGRTVYAELRPRISLWQSDDRYIFDERVPAKLCRGSIDKPE